MRLDPRLLVLSATVVLASLTPGAAHAAGSRATARLTPAAEAQQLLRLVNQHRAALGLRQLTMDPALTAAAVAWSTDMVRTAVLAHNLPLFSRASHHRLGIRILGENVAFDENVPSAHTALLGSPPHRESIENPTFALAGFAVRHSSDGWIWVTEDFGSPRATAVAAPAPRPVAVRPRVVVVAPIRHAAPRTAPKPVPVRHLAPRTRQLTRVKKAPRSVQVHTTSGPTKPVHSTAVTRLAGMTQPITPGSRTPAVLFVVAGFGLGLGVRRLRRH